MESQLTGKIFSNTHFISEYFSKLSSEAQKDTCTLFIMQLGNLCSEVGEYCSKIIFPSGEYDKTMQVLVRLYALRDAIQFYLDYPNKRLDTVQEILFRISDLGQTAIIQEYNS